MKKLKFPLLFAGVAVLSIMTNCMTSYAQPPQIFAQNFFPIVSDLNLSTEQKNELKQIQENTNSQLKTILNPQQQEKLQGIRTNRQNIREMFAQLNLTQEQRNQVQTIIRSAKEQSFQVLTEEQREQIRQQMNVRQRPTRFRRGNR